MQYIVHMERNDIFDWQLSVTRNERRVAMTFYNGHHNGIKEADSISNPGDTESWYTDDKERAEILADEIARLNPGRKVNIYSLQSVTTCLPGKPSRAQWSEKGLLPA
jgi:hypothetical protein